MCRSALSRISFCRSDSRRLAMWGLVPGLLLLAPVLPSEPAAAQTGASTSRVKSQKTPGRYRGAGQYRGSQAKQQIQAHRQRRANRHLVSPIGGAANVRPGFYDQLGGGQVVFNGGVLPNAYPSPYGYPAQPYVIYVDGNAIEPPIYGEPRYDSPPVETRQLPPVYIVNQQPPPQVIQVAAPSPEGLPLSTDAGSSEPNSSVPALAAPPKHRPTEAQPLSLSIHPADARVYLDSEPLGRADAVVSALNSLDPGIYVLEVLHENHLPQRLVFGVTEFPVSIAIDLSSDRPGGRARVK